MDLENAAVRTETVPLHPQQPNHVELALMRAGEHKVARSYVLYREERSRQRKAQQQEQAPAKKRRVMQDPRPALHTAS